MQSGETAHGPVIVKTTTFKSVQTKGNNKEKTIKEEGLILFKIKIMYICTIILNSKTWNFNNFDIITAFKLN